MNNSTATLARNEKSPNSFSARTSSLNRKSIPFSHSLACALQAFLCRTIPSGFRLSAFRPYCFALPAPARSAPCGFVLLRCSRRGILAVNGDNDYPYAIPINYLYDENAHKIIFHGAKAGYKVDCLKACDKVCFTVCGNESIKEESWAPFLQSVVVFGRCHLVENQEDIIKLVKKFAMKYYPDEKMVDEEVASSGRAVQMFEIEIEHLSGKEVQER